jgi:hypothetical protein
MSEKIKPLPPVKFKINWFNSLKLFFMVVISIVLWLTLFVTGLNILFYYIYTIFQNGFFDPEALKYAVLISVGSYLCLIIDKNKIYDALKIKRDLKFITIDEINDKE